MSSEAKPIAPAEDLTGRSRFARNVVFAWGGYAVNIVAGFIVPRLISDRLGQSTLGIWDFAWSMVSYFGIVNLGLGGSLHRYVARHRATADHEALGRSVSTIGLFLKLAALIVVVLTLVTGLWIVPLFHERLGADVSACQWVVGLLGLEIAVSMWFAAYTGVLVGCHRWDAHNTISAVVYAVSTVGMIVALLAGGGLPWVALAHCVAFCVGDIVRARVALRVCPELQVSRRLASWETWKEQARFTAKSLIPGVAELLSNQTLALLIASFLGPATLAVFSRPTSLVRQLQTMAVKFGNILTPTASSLQARADHEALRETFRNATGGIAALAVPAIATMAVFGDYLIRLWMGDKYVCEGLVTILALGAYASIVAEPVWSILSGMNLHGRVALARLAGSVCSAALLAVGLAWLKWNLIGAALCFILPKVVVDGLVTPVVACGRVGMSLRDYYWVTLLKPLLCAAPFICCLGLARITVREPLAIPVSIAALGVAALAGMYWAFIVPQELRRKITVNLSAAFACKPQTP